MSLALARAQALSSAQLRFPPPQPPRRAQSPMAPAAAPASPAHSLPCDGHLAGATAALRRPAPAAYLSTSEMRSHFRIGPRVTFVNPVLEVEF